MKEVAKMKNEWLKKSVEERVSWYKEKINKLMDLIGDKNSLSRVEKQKCEVLLKEIKENFKTDNKFSNSQRRLAKVSEAKKRYYDIIGEASTRISSRTDSAPIKSNWYSQLYDVIGDLDYRYPKIE